MFDFIVYKTVKKYLKTFIKYVDFYKRMCYDLVIKSQGVINMIYGYCRVSSQDQSLARQIKAMKDAGITERYIYTDKQSGKTFNRPSYNLLVGTDETAPLLREGDLLVIYSIDRLGRNYTEIMEQWQYITREIGADIKVLDMPLLDTSAADGNNSLDRKFVADLVLQILSYVAEKERLNINARQQQGLAAMPLAEDQFNLDGSKKRISAKTGRAIGRQQAQFPEEWEPVYKDWKDKRITAVGAMRKLNLTKNTFYNLAKRYEQQQDS